jgi:murein DD-endopeptidase MepM/ murein hydrolase activator NlpD
MPRPPVPGAVTPRGAYRFNRGDGVTHAGVDLRTAPGERIVAPETGIVYATENEHAAPWRGYAPVVLLRGDSGRFHLLAHVKAGSQAPAGVRVLEGQQVAQGGTNHVHWEVRSKPWADAGRKSITVTESPLAWLQGRRGDLLPWLLAIWILASSRR